MAEQGMAVLCIVATFLRSLQAAPSWSHQETKRLSGTTSLRRQPKEAAFAVHVQPVDKDEDGPFLRTRAKGPSLDPTSVHMITNETQVSVEPILVSRSRQQGRVVQPSKAKRAKPVKCSIEACTTKPLYSISDQHARHQPKSVYAANKAGAFVELAASRAPTVRYFCAAHRPDGAEPFKFRGQRCQFGSELGDPTCLRWPSYGSLADRRARFCRAHAPPGSVNVKSSFCVAPHCGVQATFGEAGGGAGRQRPQYCSAHRAPHHVDLKSRRCGAEGCGKGASFGATERTRKGGAPRFCAEHRALHHLRARARRCAQPGCPKVPTFGEAAEGEIQGRRALYCAAHRLSSHVDVVNKVCTVLDCPRRAEVGQGARVCKAHGGGAGGAFFGREFRCLGEGCSRQATHGDSESGVPVYCVLHRAPYHVPLEGWPWGAFGGAEEGGQKRQRWEGVRQLYQWASQPLERAAGEGAREGGREEEMEGAALAAWMEAELGQAAEGLGGEGKEGEGGGERRGGGAADQ